MYIVYSTRCSFDDRTARTEALEEIILTHSTHTPVHIRISISMLYSIEQRGDFITLYYTRTSKKDGDGDGDGNRDRDGDGDGRWMVDVCGAGWIGMDVNSS